MRKNDRRMELRPIPDKEFTRWQAVLNPVFERALHGPKPEVHQFFWGGDLKTSEAFL